MTDHSCPQCGSSARLLFNLVACITPECRNYEETWHTEWMTNNHPKFRHSPYGFGIDHKFMGGFTSSKGAYFDLYFCQDQMNSNFLGLARCSNDDTGCYYVDNGETEIGTIATGPMKSVSSCVVEALQASLKKMRAMLKKKK